MAKQVNYQCGICKQNGETSIAPTLRSLKSHLGRKHKIKQPYARGVVIETTQPASGMRLDEWRQMKAKKLPSVTGKTKRRYTKRQVITPDLTYIDIPVILRVPLVIGKGQIIK